MKLLWIPILLLALTTCGKKEASDEQKAKVKEINHAASTVVSSGQSASRRRHGRNDTNALSSVQSNEKLTEAISEADCKFDMSDPSTVRSSMSFKIAGDGCPLAMEFDISATSQKQGNLRIFFELRSEELKQLIDVTRFELQGPVSQDGGSLDGSILSKKYGSVGLSVKFSQNSIEGTYKFSDFEITLKIEKDGNKLKYSINDQEVSEQEMADLLGRTFGAGGGSSSESYTYTYSESLNGVACTTGERKFSSFIALCEGLQSRSLNNNCAEEQRKRAFKSYDCTGTFQSRP